MRMGRAIAWLFLPVLLCACSRSPSSNVPVSPAEPAVPEAPIPAEVLVEQRDGQGWRPVTALDAFASPGPGALRLRFSKPVRTEEVEQALLAAQAAPVRGLMEWSDEKTLIWQVAELPPRIDFLLGGAHDVDGLPLPGGIPSLRVGEPPTLVEVDVSSGAERPLGILPPDIVTASLVPGERAVNLIAWTPGTTRWDWQTEGFHFDLEQGELKRGRLAGGQPRLPLGVEQWVVSPGGSLVAGVRPGEGGRADLVIAEVQGGRHKTFPAIPGRNVRLAWSPDERHVAALGSDGPGETSRLAVIDAVTGEQTATLADLPVRAGESALSWSGDGRFLLAGHLLVEVETLAFRPLSGAAPGAQGAWEPAASRLAYQAEEWGPVALIEPQKGTAEPLGDGMLVGWPEPGKLLIIRWPSSASRYLPPGQ